MMKDTGETQHYIPQMLLKGFGKIRKRKSGKNIYNVLVCSKEKKYIRSTQEVATENYFYSDKNDSTHLDARITEYEANVINKHLLSLKCLQEYAIVDPLVASELVAHLALRTSHLRKSLALGVKRMAVGLSVKIDTDDLFSRMAGIHDGVASEFFCSNIEDFLNNNPYPFKHEIPQDIISKVLFTLFRENKKTLYADIDPLIKAFFLLYAKSEDIIKKSHKSALLTTLASQAHIKYLCNFKWYINKAPIQGAILPDCVVIALDSNQLSSPYVFRENSNVDHIILPLDSERLLVGSIIERHTFEDYNINASKCCNRFFICNPDFCDDENLKSSISINLNNIISGHVDGAIDSLECLKQDNSEVSVKNGINNFFIRFLHGFNENDLSIVANEIALIACHTYDIISTSILEGVILTNSSFEETHNAISDFKLPLYHIQNKNEQLRNREITFQMATSENNTFSYFIICSYSLAYKIIGSEKEKNSALYDISHIIASLSLVNLKWSPLQNNTYKKEFIFEDKLYSIFESYVGHRVASSLIKNQRDDLFDDVVIFFERLVYILKNECVLFEDHKDFSIFLNNTTDTVATFLRNLASFLGLSTSDKDKYEHQLEQLRQLLLPVGLANWLPCFEEDLERLFENMARTGTIHSFQALNNHFERILWPASFFVSKAGTGFVCHMLPPDAFVNVPTNR